MGKSRDQSAAAVGTEPCLIEDVDLAKDIRTKQFVAVLPHSVIRRPVIQRISGTQRVKGCGTPFVTNTQIDESNRHLAASAKPEIVVAQTSQADMWVVQAYFIQHRLGC